MTHHKTIPLCWFPLYLLWIVDDVAPSKRILIHNHSATDCIICDRLSFLFLIFKFFFLKFLRTHSFCTVFSVFFLFLVQMPSSFHFHSSELKKIRKHPLRAPFSALKKQQLALGRGGTTVCGPSPRRIGTCFCFSRHSPRGFLVGLGLNVHRSDNFY